MLREVTLRDLREAEWHPIAAVLIAWMGNELHRLVGPGESASLSLVDAFAKACVVIFKNAHRSQGRNKRSPGTE